jgi:hypothetical protein
VAIALGAGDDLMDVGVDNVASDFAVFQGQVRIDGGAGVDTLHYLPVSLGGTRFNVLAVAPIITTVESVL